MPVLIRNLNEGECLTLDTGFNDMPLMSEWVWIAENKDKQIGCLIAAPAHGTVILLRISLNPRSNPATAMLLLRRVFSDCIKRGFFAYLVMLQDDQPAEVKMMRLALKANGKIEKFSGVIAIGRMDLVPLE